MPNINNCVPYRAGTCSSFVSSENGCKHEAKNPDKKAIRQFKVDGEVFPKGHDPERCDWLLLDDTKGNAYYIELKGSDIPHAIEQIESTIREIHCRFLSTSFLNESYIKLEHIRFKKALL